ARASRGTPVRDGDQGRPRAHELGRVHAARPSRKPSRQLPQCGCQPSSRFAFAFDEPRIWVIIETPTSPAASRPSQTGTPIGFFAPTTSARYGSHSATDAGSSSTTL